MAVSPAVAGAQSDTLLTCPSTYQVLQNEQIGELRLTAGAYFITVLNPANLSCAKAAQNFTEFLGDYDGVLRRPWIYESSTSRFVRGAGSPIGFFVSRQGPVTGGGTKACRGTFRVLHDDHIGRLRVKAGPYRIYPIDQGSLSCSRASQNFAEFLQDYDGRLRRPWIIASLRTATFTRGAGADIGFRVKPATRSSGGSGGGRSQGECPGTFRVVNGTKIGPVSFRRGPYLTFPSRGSGLSCAQVTRQFASFLNNDFAGLPRPWTLNGTTGTFRNGSKPGFRVKPAK